MNYIWIKQLWVLYSLKLTSYEEISERMHISKTRYIWKLIQHGLFFIIRQIFAYVNFKQIIDFVYLLRSVNINSYRVLLA